MVYTVTLNPTLDYVLALDEIQPGRVNRAHSETLRPGGKGVNVSIILSRLGVENTALGFVAGFTGDEFCRLLAKEVKREDFLRLEDGRTRINLVLETGVETEINTAGPAIPPQKLTELMRRLDALAPGDTLVLAGSVPPSVPGDIYRHILERLASRRVHVTVDATGDLLREVLPLKPFLIKPNIHELGALFGVQLNEPGEAELYARKLQQLGARNVLVSMDSRGALLLSEDGGCHYAPSPEGRVENAVGSGDSMVAGFVAGYSQNQSYREAFYMGLAAGSASAFNSWLATGAEIRALYEKITRPA